VYASLCNHLRNQDCVGFNFFGKSYEFSIVIIIPKGYYKVNTLLNVKLL
jgi:hypothetical protein